MNFPDHVDKYIQEELKFGAMIGPFELPIKVHISPFMTRDKHDSDTRHTIMNLSWPKGCSVNSGIQGDTYLGTTFELHYPSVDDLVNRLNTLGPSAKIFKVDISRAVRHINIDHGDIDLLGLCHKDKYYLDSGPAFWVSLGVSFL